MDADQTYQNHASAVLKSEKPSVEGFGTPMQSISAEQFKGGRVRFSRLMNSEEASGWSGLWMRVDKGTQAVRFDNMHERPATGIAFGILLTGPGEVWLNSVKFEIVGAEVPSTNMYEKRLPDKPVKFSE